MTIMHLCHFFLLSFLYSSKKSLDPPSTPPCNAMNLFQPTLSVQARYMKRFRIADSRFRSVRLSGEVRRCAGFVRSGEISKGAAASIGSAESAAAACWDDGRSGEVSRDDRTGDIILSALRSMPVTAAVCGLSCHLLLTQIRFGFARRPPFSGDMTLACRFFFWRGASVSSTDASSCSGGITGAAVLYLGHSCFVTPILA